MSAAREGTVLLTAMKSINKQNCILPCAIARVCFRFACRNLFFTEGK